MDEPFHSVHFYFPCKVLNGVADDAKAPWIGELRYEPGKGNDDPVVRAPTLSILPVLHWPEQANQLVVDHVMLTVGFYVGQVYGSLEVVTRRPRGLAPWPERRAKEYFDANLDGQIPLAELARECGVSTSQFSRAFRQTTATSRIDGSASAHRERKAAPVQYAIVAVRGGFGPAVLPTKAISHGRLPSFRGPVLAPGSAFITNGLTLWEFRTAAHAPDTIYTSH